MAMDSPAADRLPNETPRPDGELQELEHIWATPRGFRLFTEVNNTVIGNIYLGTAFMFFLLAGLLALLMRTQLAVGYNRVVSQELYNQLFTVHGTTMMFLFAVPAMEALGVLLLPQMLAARDLPFPRLSAFAFWAYLIGGSVFFSTIFFSLAPDGGWFMYPPLTGSKYSPGDNADFWLLGIGFIEISAIAGAVEIVVGTLRTRAPGMTLARMPIFAWAMLIFAGMIIFAFPAVILATMLLELERAFGWPFFVAEKGGDPLLWQHLFWFFGHPEVYIIFLPASALVSMIVPAMARTRLVGHDLIVIAIIATAFFSFGLWVHHMFATGIPALSLGFFSAVSMAVAIPSGIQVFAWIATIASAKGKISFSTPMLFVLGFLFNFTLGGLTGVMVAMVPFDWQVHDTYFVVAHFHYVLVGGMVFPLFACFYYWMPIVSRNALSERLGRLVFWLVFIGFNVTFLPMHLTGLLGMPRRVWTYSSGMGWDLLNLMSTAGAFILAAGIGLFVIDLLRRFRPGTGKKKNLWNAPTLEWLPGGNYSTRSIPHVTSREPLWDQLNLSAEVEAGQHYLPNAPTGRRETIMTSTVESQPQYILQMPGPSWTQFLASVFTAAFFLLLTVKMVTPAIICAVIAIACCLVWAWELDPGPGGGPVSIGGGYRLPVYLTGPQGHGWWAMVVLMLVAGSLYLSFFFSYLYMWTVSPEVWPSPNAREVPSLGWPLLAASLFVVAIAAFTLAWRTLPPPGPRNFMTSVLVLVGALCLTGAIAVEVAAHWQAGLRPTDSVYGAMVYLSIGLTGQIAVAVVIMSAFTSARHLAGKLDAVRCGTFENTALLLFYCAAQGLFSLILIHGFPRLIG
jgi:cytochrome c oxidase subunit I+III